MELDELLAKTIIGKFFSKLTISELDLGVQFPEIKNLEVSSAELHPTEGHIEMLDILMSLDYKGDFLLKIDADMVLGKKGNLSMRVKQLTGKARLQFTRKPFSHWSISFIQEPVVDLAIESKIQGRQMQSNVTSLIASAVKKAIRRKHVLPNYKLRFKPFFNRLIYDEVDMPVEMTGSLEVTLRTLTRASYPKNLTSTYATMTLSSLAWITAQQHDDQNVIITIDIEIHKAKNQQIGIIFKQTDRVCIETIIPKTPAAVANIKRGDVLISIEGRKLNHINQVAKLLKTLNQTVITLRIERIVPGFIRNDASSLDDFADVYEDFDSGNSVSFSKNSDSIQIGNELKVATSLKLTGKDGSNESSKTSTPSNSPRKVLHESKPMETTDSSTSHEHLNIFIQHSSNTSPISDYVRMEDSTLFNLHSSSLFLNINVFGRSKNNDSFLLGYVNIPIENVLAECSESNFNYIEKFMLNPPEMPELSNHSLSAQSGFSSSICFGDICVGFCWNHEHVSTTELSRPASESTLRVTAQSSQEKLDVEVSDETSQKHDFVRTHFSRSTVCDFCGKKIWLKDAVQCRECSMSCHKKCMVKSQTSTVCSGTIDIEENDETTQPEFKVTAVDGDDDDCEVADEALDNYAKLSGHRQSFSELLSQGIKRVNSANNLNIPTLVSSLSQNSKSLPPTPQQTPRKRSLIATNMNPFIAVVHKLELIPADKTDMSSEEIKNLVDPLDRWGTLDDLMELAKSSSDFLYADLETDERIQKINALVSSSFFFSFSTI